MKVSVLVAALLLGSSWLLAQERGGDADAPAAPALFPDGYLDHDALEAALAKLSEAHPEVVRLRTLGWTLGGRPVRLVTVGTEPPEDDEDEDEEPEGKAAPRRPAVLVVANLEADHLVGSQVALGLVERLAGEADLLEKVTFHVVPRLNPDGAERALKAEPRAHSRLNFRPVDRDRDGEANEDGPNDLDGDGLALRMRVKDAAATLVPDARDARLLRKADAAKGERPVYSEYPESQDDDGDGRRGEDPPGGVNLNRNWPHRWTEFDPEAGFSPASEPSVHALIRFAFDHPEIAAVWTLSLNDNLKAEPKNPAAGIDPADLPIFAELSKAYNKAIAPAEPKKDEAKKDEPKKDEPKKDEPGDDEPKAEAKTADAASLVERLKAASPEERTKMLAQLKGQVTATRGGPAPGAPGGAAPASGPSGAFDELAATTDGAMSEWAYHQFGVVGLASRPWTTPEIADPPAGRPKPPADGDARWLYWNDHVVDGRAFVPFKEFEHPELGPVEIGGWVPGVRLNPPAAEVDALADAHLAFLKDLAGRLARLDLVDVKVEAKGGGVFEVVASVINEGTLPTALAQGVRTRKAPPVLVRLKAGEAKILAGRALERVDALPGAGGRREFRWLVLAPEGGTVELEAACPKAGTATRTVELR